MSSLTLLPEVSSAYYSYSSDCLKPQDCLIIDPNQSLGPRLCELWRDLGTEYDLEKEAPPAAAAAAAAEAAEAAVAPTSEDFVGLAWSSDGLTDAAEEEARILDDLLRLGLELGDLEDVFGNTEIDPTLSAQEKKVEDLEEEEKEVEQEEEEEIEVEVVGVVEEEGGGGDDCGVGSEAGVGTGGTAPTAVSYAQDSRGEDDKDLLLDADLQDALLNFPEIDFVGEEEEGDDEDVASSWTPSTALDLEVQSISSPLTEDSEPPADAGGQVSSAEDVAVDVSAPFPGGDHQASSSMEDAAVDVSIPFPEAAECRAATAAFVCEEGGGGGSGSDGGGASGGRVCNNDLDSADTKNHDDGNTTPPSTATKTDRPPAGVPTRLLDAIDLWESAHGDRASEEHARSKSREGRGSAAKPARSGRKTSGGGGGGGHKKKKNEFGKRRRSSGGGNAPAPGTLLKEATSKGKVDPLTALKDVRRLSRKPLIVQWLRSDGCPSDEEAEAAVSKAVGSLASIANYWGSGGG